MNTPTTTWKLNDSQFTLIDRAKLAWFVLSDNQWTQSKHTAEFECKMAQFVGSKYAVFVANGSLANTLIAMYLRDKHVAMQTGNTVVFPSTTWMTSISPFIREGFDEKFIDVNLENFSMDLNKLEQYLKKSAKHVACVFVTSLLGFNIDINNLLWLRDKYQVTVMIDNCENTLGISDGKNVSSFVTSTTSTYFGHQLQSVEGGFVFTNDPDEYEYFLMARCHGLVRGLPESLRQKHSNPDVDSRFDFSLLGNNFRNTDIHAFIGMLDLKRVNQYRAQREMFYNLFRNILNKRKVLDMFIMPNIITLNNDEKIYPFCIPIILKKHNPAMRDRLIKISHEMGVETRPICTGNIVRQTPFKNNYRSGAFDGAEHLHHNGFYLGLHGLLNKFQVEKFAETLVANMMPLKFGGQ